LLFNFDDLAEGDNDGALEKEGREEAAVEQRQQLPDDYPNNNINNNNDNDSDSSNNYNERSGSCNLAIFTYMYELNKAL